MAAVGVQAVFRLQYAVIKCSVLLWLNFPVVLSVLPYHTGEGPCLSLLKAASVHDVIAALKMKAVALKKSFAVPLNR